MCQHHWVISTPEGPYSQGTCRKCGSTRQFRNWDPATDMGDLQRASDGTTQSYRRNRRWKHSA